MDSESDVPAQSDIPQSEPLNQNQVSNNAGGYVFEIDDFSRLRRFIILGSDGNNYYISAKELNIQNCDCVLRLFTEGNGVRVVEEVTRISREGRAPRQSTGILVLAVCARLGDLATRRAALAALPAVCRTASTLFEFVQRCKELGPVTRATRTGDAAATPEAVMDWREEQQSAGRAAAQVGAGGGRVGRRIGGRCQGRGRRVASASPPARLASRAGGGGAADWKASWGRSMRRAIALWYLDKAPAAVAYQVTKYSQRNGWSHADLLRLAHPDPEAHAAKRLKAVAKAAEEAMRVEKEEVIAGVSGGSAAAAAATTAVAATATATAAASETDSDWVMVSQKATENGSLSAGEDDDGGALGGASELGALVSAMETMAVETGARGTTDGASAAAEAQSVADMKAIFDFLTHGTLPGQERAVRRAGRPREVDENGTGTAAGTEQVSTAAAAVAGVAGAELNAMDCTASVSPHATSESTLGIIATDGTPINTDEGSTAEAGAALAESVAAAPPPEDVGVPVATEAMSTGPVGMQAAAVPPEVAAAPAASQTVISVPLSPVMQYLVDAHRLRKDIHAPPSLVKPPKEERLPKRRRGVPMADEEEAQAEGMVVAPDPDAVAANEAARAATVELAVSLVRRHRFGHEHVGDTSLLQSPDLWAAFLEVGMPLTALLRNLGRMTAIGLMQREGCLARITSRLRNARALAAARLHPMTILEAMCTYRKGQGLQGVARWVAEPEVLGALEAAFYLAFKNVVPTGQRYLAGLDVSASMGSSCSGMTSVSCRRAAAAMLMSLVRVEPWVKTLAFAHKLEPLTLTDEDKLEDVLSRTSHIPFGRTDCALPILHALEHRIPVDVFVILTDNETWWGKVHPTEALKRYRRIMDLPNAKLVVLAFSSTSFSIADPDDPGMLDVAGLDSAVPQLVSDFAAGRM